MFLGWSKDDRDKAIWQYVRDKQTCRSCGTRPDEWATDAGGHQHAYGAAVARCRGCEVLEAERDRIKDKPLGGGTYVRLERRN
ncbi:hypothetical protein [Verrucosispora sp. WMMD1129]|uniref:hypothetical protein n=1 Tax=Verrucosispora sp. WMMD1129 TaxID=3016093 RepID=UPI00249A9C70|nr:hypothetical protein [Verrucosispora sp. WMMD1129]WFE45301.1 hypothetical protein O7624_13550 [Verrucosispora sp. WMMD1129]